MTNYKHTLQVLDHIDLDFYLINGRYPTLTERSGFSVTDMAMLASLKSRSANGVDADLNKVREKGSEFFIEQFYKKYGHGSIGQNSGTIGVYAEKVSMLAAKAIQDDVFYNGQESSSRYLDFSKMEVVVPDGLPFNVGVKMHDSNRKTMEIYNWAVAETMVWLRETINPELIAGKTETEITGIVKARAFDICRCILPAGTTTYVAWHALIETLSRRLPDLMADPLNEVKALGILLEEQLLARYPESFDKVSDTDLEHAAIKHMFDNDQGYVSGAEVSFVNFHPHGFNLMVDFNRQKRQRLPKAFKQFGTIDWSMEIDFGSWRDIQRHREFYTNRPVLTPNLGFETWYTDNMPAHVATQVKFHMIELTDLYMELYQSCDDEMALQYMVPMGFKVTGRQIVSLPQFVYICELRSGQTVHPTARKAVLEAWAKLEEAVEMEDNFQILKQRENVLELLNSKYHIDKRPSTISVRRGNQDIEGIRD